MLTKMNGAEFPSSEQTWRHHRADLTIASSTTFTDTNRRLKHNNVVQNEELWERKALQR